MPEEAILAKWEIPLRVTVVFKDWKNLSRIVLFLVPGVLFSGCGAVGDGDRTRSGFFLSRKIEFAPRYNIERAIITVFQGDGFEILPGSGTSGTFRFVREGDALGRERFGEWFGPGVFLRVKVAVTEVEFGTHRVSSALEIRREDQFVTTQEGSRRVKVLLGRVKKLAGLL
ncbi:MAG: hypothetical protein DBX00_05295 [Verrucomicrobia bacterium]|nr:hypothetical protein [Roseibacillus sp.]RCL37167.1 MAG: hypothetical protein DBX00_05295 [Verrucomicrobiota bacterium]